MNIMSLPGGCRVVVLLIVLLTLTLPVRETRGQEIDQPGTLREMFQRSRTVAGPRYDCLQQCTSHQAVVEAARLLPIGLLRSSLSLQSHVTFFPLAAGFRRSSTNDTALRVRAGLFDADIYRSPLAVGATVADYNRSGRFRLEARWIAIRLGPSIRWSGSWGAVEPRLIGTLGASSLTLGPAYEDEVGAAANDRITGFDRGYRLVLPFRTQRRFTAELSAGERLLIDRSRLSVDTIQLETRGMILSQLQLFFRYTWERTHLDDRSVSTQHLRTGVRLMF